MDWHNVKWAQQLKELNRALIFRAIVSSIRACIVYKYRSKPKSVNIPSWIEFKEIKGESIQWEEEKHLPN